MRNLKRILSLAMASIMLVGMMVVGASAVDFPDSDKIENTDAVNTMVALGIIKGKDDGNFDPEGIVTRAEMAKMICVAMNGGKDPNLSGAGLYPDTKGHWAAGYIDYCTNLGIVSGDNKGNFNPNATITGVEAAKMILIAIGYNAENEKYVNDANWDTNIGVDASTKDLYKDVAINPMEGLTRDNAAQMLWNGMQAEMVEYDYKVGAVDGNVTSIAIAKDRTGKTILTEKFSMDTDVVILTGVKKDNKDTYTLTATKVDTDAHTRFTKVENDVSSLLGQEVKILYKKDKTDSVYGVYATNNNDVVEAYQKDISKDGAKKVKIDGTSYELEDCTFITDGEVGAAATSTNLVDEASFNSVKLIDNDGDDKYEYAVVTVVKPVKVSYISSTEIIAGGETYKDKDNDIADGLKKGDYVTVTYSIGGDNYSIVKMEQQEGKISGYKAGTENDQYKIDGDWYTVAGKVSGITGAGKTITFCAVNGVIVKDTVEATDSSTLDNVAMILASDPETAVNRNVKIMLADGTKKNVSLDKFVDGDNKTKTVSDSDAVGKLYTYSVTDNGYKFKDINNVGDFKWTASAADDVLDKDGNATGKVLTLGVVGKKFSIADDAKIFVYLDNDAKILTGKQVKNLVIGTAIKDQSLGFFTGEVGGINRVVLGALTANGSLPEGKDEASNYALVVEDSYIEDEDYITYKIWDGSDVVTVREKDTTIKHNQMDVIAYSTLDGDVIKDVTVPAGLTRGAVKGLLGDEISFDGVVMNKLDKDTVYMYYDSSAEDAEEIGVRGADRDIVVLADKVEEVYVENVKYVLNSDGTVAFILVDSKNKLADATSYTIAGTQPTNATWDLPANAKAGELVKVTITPDSGYHLTTAGAATVTDATFVSDIVIKDGVATFTFVMPAKNVTAVSVTTGVAKDATPAP